MVFSISRGIIGSLAKGFFSNLSQKESEREMLQAEDKSSFSVHAPKWMLPCFILLMMRALAIGMFLYTKGIKQSIIGTTIAECVLIMIFAYEKEFIIKIDGQEIFVRRMFRTNKTFLLKELTNCMTGNDGTVKINFGEEKIAVSCIKVNSGRFYEFAKQALYDQVDKQRIPPYKIIRNKGERKFIFFCASIAAALFSICLFSRDESSLADKINAITVFGGIIIAALLYFPVVNMRSIIVDEASRSFSYMKGFKRHSASFSQIEEIAEKKRLCEEVAINYLITALDENGKIFKKKISSLDKNATRFALLLFKLFEDANDEV